MPYRIDVERIDEAGLLRLLDVGTGSGVLALAALAHGVPRAVAKSRGSVGSVGTAPP